MPALLHAVHAHQARRLIEADPHWLRTADERTRVAVAEALRGRDETGTE